MRARISVVLLLLASQGCATPARDNAEDPQNRPVARLSIVDARASDGSCPAVTAPLSGSHPTVLVASRGACLGLDASTSTDPQVGTQLHFSFALVDSAGEHALSAASDLEPALRLDPNLLRVRPLSAPAMFRVTVSDGLGSSRANAAVVLTNSRPIARANTPQTRVLDSGTTAVTFDASASIDPDGDPLTYCWSIPTGAPEVCGAAMRSVSLDLSKSGRTAGRVRVTDGDLHSGEAFTSFSVRERTPLLADIPPANNGTVFTALDVQPDDIDLGSSFSASAAVDGTALLYGANVQVAQLSKFFVGETTLASPSQSSTLQIFGNGGGAFVTDPHVPGAALVSGGSSLNDSGFGAAFAGDPDVQVMTAAATLSQGVQLAVDSQRDLWAVDSTGLPITITHADLVSPTLPNAALSDYRPVVGMQERPGTSEMWILRRPSGNFAIPTLEAWTATASAPAFVREVTIPLDDAIAFTWIDHDELWLFDGNAALRIDLALLEAGAPIEEATLARVALDYTPVEAVMADPFSGDLHFAGIRNQDEDAVIVDISADGRVSAFDVAQEATPPRIRTIDPDGRLWETVAGGGGLLLRRSISPLHDQRLAPRGFPAFLGAVAEDLASANLWAMTLNSPPQVPELRRLAPDGTMRAWPRLDEGANGLVLPPDLGLLRLTADGRTAWGFASSVAPNLYRLDLTTDPPTLTGVPGAFSAVSANSVLGPLPDGRAWIAPDTAASTIPVEIVDAAGTVTPVFTIPAGESGGSRVVKTAVMPASGNLCLATVVGATPAFQMRRLTPGGGVLPLANVPATTTTPLLSAGAASDSPGGRDLCWFAVAENGTNGDALTVLAYDASGTLVHSFSDTTIPGRVGGIVAIAADAVSLVLPQQDGMSVVGTLRFPAGSVGGGVWSPLPLEYRESFFLSPYGANGF